MQEEELEIEVEHPLKKIAGAIEAATETKLTAKGYAALVFYNHFLLAPTMIEKGDLKGSETVGLMPRFDSWDSEV